MHIVQRSGSRLVLRDTPIGVWLFAGAFLAMAIFLALQDFGLLGWAFAAMAFSGCMLPLVAAGEVVTIDFDQPRGTLTVRHWLFGPRDVSTYSIRGVVGVAVESTTDSDGDQCYRLSLTMANGATITPVAAYSGGSDKHRAAGVIRGFLRLDMPDDDAVSAFRSTS